MLIKSAFAGKKLKFLKEHQILPDTGVENILTQAAQPTCRNIRRCRLGGLRSQIFWSLENIRLHAAGRQALVFQIMLWGGHRRH